MEFILIDSMIARARQAAAGAPLKREAAIPPRSHRKSPRAYNAELYTERNLVGCLGFLQFVSAFMGI